MTVEQALAAFVRLSCGRRISLELHRSQHGGYPKWEAVARRTDLSFDNRQNRSHPLASLCCLELVEPSPKEEQDDNLA